MEQELKSVFDGIIANERDELRGIKDPAELERFWFFKYEPKHSMAWNTYQFHSMLNLYQNKCRRWEEMHNGISCVVERVRDTYVMPKIREWISIVQAETNNPNKD